jgi:uncharacterized membrane protein (UPF0182 family)
VIIQPVTGCIKYCHAYIIITGGIDTAYKIRLEIILALAFFIIALFLPGFSKLALNYLWFESIGYANVFVVKYVTQIILFFLSTLLSVLILLMIYRSGKKTILQSGKKVISFWDSRFFAGYSEEYIDMKPEKNISPALNAVQFPVYMLIIFFSILYGLIFSRFWLTILMYLNRTPFNQTDPIFNNDIAFYVFSLPFYKVLLDYFLVILFFGLLLLVGLYAVFNWKLLTRIPANLRMVLVGFILIYAVKSYLGRYNILYSETGVVYGAGYIDVTIEQYIPVILSIVFFLSALGILLKAWLKNVPVSDVKILIGMVAIIFLIIIIGSVITVLLQEYKVTPNELELERPYIMNNIQLTNDAYGLSNVEVKQYPLIFNLTTDILNDPTITNARLWDYRPLYTTYQQKQALRTYYGFNDVDVDRYYINGNKTQVWLSAREIYYNQLPSETWLNRHVLYTHGIGVVMSPVNKIAGQGLPEMYIENIPPISNIPSLIITQPRLYFGEKTDTYIFTGTGRDEIDYPSGSTNMVTTYSGLDGITMGGLNKLIATLALRELKILTSSDINKSSRLHINRNVIERTGLITPYLLLDPDTYVVVDDDGHIQWILSAFVTTDKYPYSEPLSTGNTQTNYIQDSVKTVVDAYNGTICFYVIEEDPLLTTYSKIFPGVFKPYDQMPASLQQHMRYSPDLFMIQSQIYRDYHMKVPEVFYNREDKWEIATEKYADSLINVEPYNVQLDLDGATHFIMMLPFTPSNKDNMIAWMAVNQDPPHYGETILYEFPKDKLIYGPAQVEALIDQDEEISQDLTLWSQGGSKVIRGNMLVIPIKESILYIEPLYISAETSSSIPELKKILLVYENKVVMADSLEEGIKEVMGENVSIVSPEPIKGDQTLTELLRQTISHYDIAKEYLGRGDLENYGREMKLVDSLLDQLGQSLNTNISS